MRRSMGFAALVVALALPTGRLHAQQSLVIDFENGPGITLTNGYSGFNWSGVPFNFWHTAIAAGDVWRPTSGTVNAFSEQGSAIWFAKPGELFTLNSMYLSEFLFGPPDRNELLTGITGLRNGQVVYSMDMVYDRTTMQKVDFNWVDIDQVSFGPIKGQILIDDISVSFTSTPEPATITLVATGLIGIVSVRRRRSTRR